MNLTEGQLFTIEALNRIKGFVWPEGAKFAAMNGYLSLKLIQFYALKPSAGEYSFSGVEIVTPDVVANNKHPDWRNSLITREQFDSVDGWVRNDGSEPVINGYFDLLLGDGEEISFSDLSVDGWDWSLPCEDGSPITHWRYHKPTKENEMKQDHPSALITDLLEQYTKKRNERERLQTEIECLQTEKDRVKDDEDKLIEKIRQWHLQYGFDIRVLDESDEKPGDEPNHEPELVITDWRDLLVGDVVWWSGDDDSAAGEYPVFKIENYKYDGSLSIAVEVDDDYSWIDTSSEKWKFIRRPSK